MRLGVIAGTLLVLIAACSGPPPRTVRQADLDAWSGAPLIELEPHPGFSTWQRNVEKRSDGGQLWTLTKCESGQNPLNCTTGPGFGNTLMTTCGGGDTYKVCCHGQFFVRATYVESYGAAGNCFTDCRHRPASRQCGTEGSLTMAPAPPDPKLTEIPKMPK